MPFPDVVSPQARRALADVDFQPYWLTDAQRPAAQSALTADIEADLVIVGGGFSGLWTAYEARRRFPDWPRFRNGHIVATAAGAAARHYGGGRRPGPKAG